MQPHQEFDSLISEDSSALLPASSIEPLQSIDEAHGKKIQFPRFFKAIHALERRRQSMSLDAAYYYLRHLELKLQTPNLYKVCNSIKTIDAVLADKQGRGEIVRNFTDTAWQKVKEQLFHILLTNYSGRFIVYSATATSPLTPGMEWSENSFVDFYPEKQTRPDEFYSLPLRNLSPANCAVLKRAFLEAKLSVRPEDFAGIEITNERSATSSLMRIYDICEQEAETGKSKANSVKNGLEAELRRCTDRQRRKEIRRHLLKLQMVWGGITI
jgi:hypothetical protein